MYLFILRERETEWESEQACAGRDREREGEPPMWGSNSWTRRSWPEPMLDVQLSEPPMWPTNTAFALISFSSYCHSLLPFIALSASLLNILSWIYSKKASYSLHSFINTATERSMSYPIALVQVTSLLTLLDLQQHSTKWTLISWSYFLLASWHQTLLVFLQADVCCLLPFCCTSVFYLPFSLLHSPWVI